MIASLTLDNSGQVGYDDGPSFETPDESFRDGCQTIVRLMQEGTLSEDRADILLRELLALHVEVAITRDIEGYLSRGLRHGR